MLKHRVRSGVVMVSALLAALYFLPPSGAILLLVLFCGWGMWEFYAMLRAGGIPHFPWIGILGGMSLLTVTWWVYQPWAPEFVRLDMEAITLFVIAAVIFIRQMFQPTMENSFQTMAGTLLGVIYVAWLFNFLNKLLLVFGINEGRWLILYLVLVVKCTDIGAFFIGCWLGGKKFFPRISPAKTWSGVFGGMASGIGVSLIALYFMQPILSHLSFGWPDALILGILLSITGIVGDLIESLLKRSSGVKDSGSTIQGMGGFLDVVDSLIFSAPVLYIYMRLFVDKVG